MDTIAIDLIKKITNRFPLRNIVKRCATDSLFFNTKDSKDYTKFLKNNHLIIALIKKQGIPAFV